MFNKKFYFNTKDKTIINLNYVQSIQELMPAKKVSFKFNDGSSSTVNDTYENILALFFSDNKQKEKR